MDFMGSGKLKKLLALNVITQIGIVITGGLVRVTSSGLGCPTWPECVEGSITPTSTQTEAWHKYVEFGNRLLTFVVSLIALLVIIAVRKSKFNRPDLILLSYGTLAGIFAQAILGGITVITKLNPITVSAHFLLSIILIAIAFNLYWRATELNKIEKPNSIPLVIRQGAILLTIVSFVLIVVGTLVTGTGPHAGDSSQITRLPFDPREITWLHADLVLLFIGLTVGLLIAAISSKLNTQIIKALKTLLVISLVQGLIGYTQYFTGLPWVAVALHIAGACLVWVAALQVLLSTNKRVNTYS